ncbi:hypothetical protein V6N13_068360 [Hibiscus sabdariffa]|uniref:Uncharacterized protein n=1 Tax=Hibiscus sabdariffa TaxID=183260 RepID=A0ABR2QMD1_9ROSI
MASVVSPAISTCIMPGTKPLAFFELAAIKFASFLLPQTAFQRVLFPAVDLLFFAVHKLYSRFLGNSHVSPDINKPLISPNRALPRTTIRFKLSLIVTVPVVLAFCYSIISTLAFTSISQRPWK